METTQQLRDLIDSYAYLGDEKKITEQMGLFTKDAIYKVYMNDHLISSTSGSNKIGEEFSGHASEVKTYFTINGQHTVSIKDDSATGVSFSQIKMIREPQGKKVITDYSVKYDDKYIYQEGNWLIKERTAYFVIVETRSLDI